MTKTKKAGIAVLSVVAVILAALSVYTVIHAFGGKPFDKMLAEMINSSIIDNVSGDDIVQRSSINSSPIGDHYLFCSTNTNSDESELFVIERKGWFGSNIMERYDVFNHSRTNIPVGTAMLDIKNSDGKDDNVICVYSSNTLGIHRIEIELIKADTNEIKKIEFYTEVQMPIASAQEIGNEFYSVKSLKCYNEKDELVYSE